MASPTRLTFSHDGGIYLDGELISYQQLIRCCSPRGQLETATDIAVDLGRSRRLIWDVQRVGKLPPKLLREFQAKSLHISLAILVARVQPVHQFLVGRSILAGAMRRPGDSVPEFDADCECLTVVQARLLVNRFHGSKPARARSAAKSRVRSASA